MSTVELPKYEQVKRLLIDEIEQGVLAPGSVVPSETELVARFKVSRPTLVRSLQDLVRDGYVYRKQGKGTFVADRLPSRDRDEAAQAFAPVLPLFVADTTARLSGDAREVLLRFMRGVEDGLSSKAINFVLRSCPEQELDAETLRYLQLTPPGTALVVEPSFFLPTLWTELLRRGWKLWALNERVNDANCVVIDQEHAGYIATQHLISRGCKHIALLNGPRKKFWGFAARYDGYRRALQESGIEFDDARVFEASHVIDSEAGRAMMRQLIRSQAPFDGVVCVTDSKAIGAMMVAEEEGLAIGDQVRFVSIDNTCADRAPHPLPAVAMPFEQVGRVAAEMAMRDSLLPPDANAFHQILLKPTLIDR